MISKILVALLLLVSVGIHAEENVELAQTKEDIHPVLLFLLVEGIIGVNAWMASEDPHTYGALSALLFPLAGSSQDSPTQHWVKLAAVESVALYNLSIDEDKKSKSEIFKGNVIAWHLVAGIVGLSGYLVGDGSAQESLKFTPVSNRGPQLVYSYKF